MDKVTGRALFGADFNTAGLLHGKILRSPHAHANILSIDTSKAEALTGVMAVVTAKDLAIMSNEIPDLSQARSNARTVAENVLAFDKVLYKGHAIAAVAANSPHVAEEPIGLIDVKREVLPPRSQRHGRYEGRRTDPPQRHDDDVPHCQLLQGRGHRREGQRG